MRVGGIMSPELEVASKDQGIFETMHQNAQRRHPESCGLGGWIPCGNYFTDDWVQLLSEEMTELAKLISREQRREMARAPVSAAIFHLGCSCQRQCVSDCFQWLSSSERLVTQEIAEQESQSSRGVPTGYGTPRSTSLTFVN
jgi:hypothetical protein